MKTIWTLIIKNITARLQRSLDKVKSTDCAKSYCGNRGDPRCETGNCTLHCRASCGGVCIELWLREQQEMHPEVKVLEKLYGDGEEEEDD